MKTIAHNTLNLLIVTGSGGIFMLIRFWGVRSQVATPGIEYARYGGNTTAISLQKSDGSLLILNAGTGLQALGNHLLKEKQVTGDKHVTIFCLLTNTRWDNSQGFPFFVPCYMPNVHVQWYGPEESHYEGRREERSLKEYFAEAMSSCYFPVRLDEFRSQQTFEGIGTEKGVVPINGFSVTALSLNCTFPSVAYRIEDGSTSVVYIPGYEEADASHPFKEQLRALCHNADVVIHNSFFAGRRKYRSGWGYGSAHAAIMLCEQSKVQKLILTGYNPGDADEEIDAAGAYCQNMLEENNQSEPRNISQAYEGLIVRV